MIVWDQNNWNESSLLLSLVKSKLTLAAFLGGFYNLIMTIRRYLILMSLGTLLSWSVVILIITMINPIGSPPYIFIMFYFSIFLACIGSLSIIGFLSRILILGRHQFLSHQLAVSFRQAIILSFLLVGFLFLQSLSLLTWWIVLVAVVIVISVDFFISIGNRRKLEIRQDQG